MAILTSLTLRKITLHYTKKYLCKSSNVAGIPIAAGILFPIFGWLLNPIIAGAAMALSSVSVVTNALRLRKFQAKPVA